MTTPVKQRRYLKIQPYMYGLALRRFRLRSNCTEEEVKLAFVREYLPVFRRAVKGGRYATRDCRKLVKFYKAALQWVRIRKPMPSFAAARGAFHEWKWGAI